MKKKSTKKTIFCPHTADFARSIVNKYEEGQAVLKKVALLEARAEDEGIDLRYLLIRELEPSDFNIIAGCIVDFLVQQARLDKPELWVDEFPKIEFKVLRQFAPACSAAFGGEESTWFTVHQGSQFAKAQAESVLSSKILCKKNQHAQAHGYLYKRYKSARVKFNSAHKEAVETRKADKAEKAAAARAEREAAAKEKPAQAKRKVKATAGKKEVDKKTEEQLKLEAEGS